METTGNPATTQTCRTITLDIKGEGRGYGSMHGKTIVAVPPPKGRQPLSAFLGAVAPGRRVEHAGRTEMLGVIGRRVVSPSSLFFQATHKCFADHHPLALRPEVLMQLISHEVAVTVKQNAEHYRGLFTSSPERKTVKVRHDGLVLGNPNSPWHEAISCFTPALVEVVPPGIMEHLLPGFTTSTQESSVASLIAFMDAASPFYDYRVDTLCGIPEIRLLGAAEDYRRIKNAAAQLGEVFRTHLGRYFDHLLPTLATLADQAAGAPVDEQFWSSMYKYESHSGSAVFNGWLSGFVNYVQRTDGTLVEKKGDLYDWKNMEGRWGIKGLNLGSVPSHVSTVPFIWDYLGTEVKMLFAGGVLGVDDFEGAVMPSLSYAVLHAE